MRRFVGGRFTVSIVVGADNVGKIEKGISVIATGDGLIWAD
jgi:Na+/H+-translocating membrane pyrophosphatase